MKIIEYVLQLKIAHFITIDNSLIIKLFKL